LKDTGAINLPNSCTLYTPTVVLKSSGEKIKNVNILVNINPDIFLLKISVLGIQIDKIINSKTNFKKANYQIPKLKKLHQSSQKLDEILSDIDKELENASTNNYQNLHVYGLYLIGGVVGYLVIHTIITKTKLYCIEEREPRILLRTKGRVLHKDDII